MTLRFNVSEGDALALTEHYYRDSASHQRVRSRSRWTVPLALLLVWIFFMARFGFSWPPTAIFLTGAIGWWLIAPKRFDVRFRKQVNQYLKESSYAKVYGDYQLSIEEEKLVSDGPAGHAEYNWAAVDRVALTEDYLFVFLSGPMGYPIRKAELGAEVAENAYDELRKKIEMAQ